MSSKPNLTIDNPMRRAWVQARRSTIFRKIENRHEKL
ncbi:hypothetical protein PEL8287_00120 [Roseovarius litorisediminis]|uniref:Uncharacterized protein n=1 Tax=Roseovarius litorisediminis TaxID=1312363 RepID=A0A1Y5RA96_9RHOB|nr:hypothetical protein PEL8287_00120 [Roseovarius litorisediminis]